MTRAVRWCWIALLIAAIVSRVVALDSVPLNPDEAQLALAAWEGRIENVEKSQASPFLLMGNALLFSFFGAGDGMARLWPVLAGVLLVMTPFLWRRRLGEVGALVAAGLLLCSPLMWVVSRRLDSTIIGLAGGILFLSALLFDTGEETRAPSKTRAVLLAVGLAVGLTGGPAFYDSVLAFAVAWSIWRLLLRGRRPGSLHDWELDLSLHGGIWPLGAGGLVALLMTIGMGSNWSGWSGLGAGLSAWLAEWRIWDPSPSVIGLLLLYEPLLLFLAVLGVVEALKHRSYTPVVFLSVWGLFALLLTSLRPGTSTLSFVVSLIPLALLGGYGISSLEGEMTRANWMWLGLHTLVGFGLWQTALLALARHTVAYSLNGFEFLGVLVIVLLQGLLAAVFALMFSLPLAVRGMLLSVVALLLSLQVSFGWGVAILRPNSPSEPLVTVGTSQDVRRLVRMVEEWAAKQGERQDTLRVALVEGEEEVTSLLRWAFRDWSRLQVVAQWPGDDVDVVIVPEDYNPLLPDFDAWRGMSFVVTTRVQDEFPGCVQTFPPACPDQVRWYLYRKTPVATVAGKVILWVQQEQGF